MTVGDEARQRVAEGLAAVRQRISGACRRVGRDPAGVRLVAVSKRHSPELVRAAYEHGQRDFGENYVQEMGTKAAALGDLDGLRWRLIGHLQRNKAKLVAPFAAAVDTVDSVRLAEALARRANEAERSIDVLIQVNVADEPQKSGCPPAKVPDVVDAVRRLQGLELRGLMCIPPWSEQPERSRPYFRRLRELADADGLPERSMGMSHDLEGAIEEGATMVRVGTAIFGPRPG